MVHCGYDFEEEERSVGNEGYENFGRRIAIRLFKYLSKEGKTMTDIKSYAGIEAQIDEWTITVWHDGRRWAGNFFSEKPNRSSAFNLCLKAKSESGACEELIIGMEGIGLIGRVRPLWKPILILPND